MQFPDRLSSFFTTSYPLNKEGLQEFFSLFETRQYRRQTLLLQAGEMDGCLRFLNEGVVREYYAREDREVNIDFYLAPAFVTDFSSFNKGTPTQKYQMCVTDVELRVLPRKAFLALMDRYPCGRGFLEQTFQQLLARKEAAERDRLTRSPEQLYLHIVEQHPEWLHHIPHYHIASYLGVTPETLSRIRKRIS